MCMKEMEGEVREGGRGGGRGRGKEMEGEEAGDEGRRWRGR